jgi:hypothetical protein
LSYNLNPNLLGLDATPIGMDRPFRIPEENTGEKYFFAQISTFQRGITAILVRCFFKILSICPPKIPIRAL